MATEATMEVSRGTSADGRSITIPTFNKQWGDLKRLQYWAGLATFDVNVPIQVVKDKYGFSVTVGTERDCDTSIALDYEAAYYLIRGVTLGAYQAVVPRVPA